MDCLQLSQHFNTEAVPKNGRYTNDPAVADANGFIYIPERNFDPTALAWKAAGVSLILVLSLVLNSQRVKKKKKKMNGQLLDVEYNY